MALIQIELLSRSLMRTVPVQVILPVDKLLRPGEAEAAPKPFKMLILLHGVFGSCGDWVRCTRVQRWADARDLCVVMPSGENSFYVDHATGASRYGQYIGEELPELMRRMFPISHRREDCFIAGLSMGGFGAMRNALRYPETFSAAASFSGAFILKEPVPGLKVEKLGDLGLEEACFGTPEEAWNSDKNPLRLAEGLAARRKAGEKVSLPRIYMSCGTEDGLFAANTATRDALVSLGFDVTWEEGPGGHEWNLWDRNIERIMDWLPLNDETEGIHSGNVR